MTIKERLTVEKQLIETYYNKVDDGVFFLEVPVGQWGVDRFPKSELRYIDAVRILIPGQKNFQNRQKFKEYLDKNEKAEIEIIEAKRELNRSVIGQSIVGATLLELDYQPYCIKQVILCKTADPLLEMICKRRGINVWTP